MNTITINGVTFNDFGANNYSNGMHLVSAYPMPDNMIKDVLAGKYPGIHLNPSAPCGSEFYGVYGTEEQYREFYNRQKEAQISKRILSQLHLAATPKEWMAAKEEAKASYKDWWN